MHVPCKEPLLLVLLKFLLLTRCRIRATLTHEWN